MHGILDRFETNNKAVILIESLNKELIVSTDSLPTGSKENTWFHIEETNNGLSIVSIDKERTQLEANKTTSLMDKLKSKKKSSKFKRN